MNQYIYRAIPVQKLDWSRVRTQVGQGRLVAAIDVAKDLQFMALMREDRSVIHTVKWSPDGLQVAAAPLCFGSYRGTSQ